MNDIEIVNEEKEYFEDELHKLLVHLHKDIPVPCVSIF